MNYLSLQQIFDKAVWGTLHQGRRSHSRTINGYACAYRGHDGAKCAVGHLIEGPVPSHINNSRVSAWSVRQLLERSGVAARDFCVMDLLKALQDAHDCASDTSVAAFRQSFADAAATIAADFGLSLLVLDEFGLYPTPCCSPSPKVTVVELGSLINEACVDWEDAKAEYFAKKEAEEMAARQAAIAAIEKAKHLQVPVPEPA